MLVFSTVTANHLGLVAEVERRCGIILPVINCLKCLSFWLTLSYCLITGSSVIPSVAVSFLAAYSALWMELTFGFIDSLYNKVYGWIYDKTTVPTNCRDKDSSASADADDSASEVSEVRVSEDDYK